MNLAPHLNRLLREIVENRFYFVTDNELDDVIEIVQLQHEEMKCLKEEVEELEKKLAKLTTNQERT